MKTNKNVTIPEVTVAVRPIRHTRTKAERAGKAAALANVREETRNENRLRLYRLLEQVATLTRNGVRNVEAVFVHQVEPKFLYDCVACSDTPGVRVTYIRREPSSLRRISNVETVSDFHVDTDDWVFEDLQEQLLYSVQEHEAHEREIAARDAVIRKLSPEDRKTLGFGNWKDPKAKNGSGPA